MVNDLNDIQRVQGELICFTNLGMKHAPIRLCKKGILEVGMLKKMLWMVILVLIVACSVYVSDGGLTFDDGIVATDPATGLTAIAVTNTEVVEFTATDEVIHNEQGGDICGAESTATVAAVTSEEPTATIESATFTPTSIPPTATPSFTPTPTQSPLRFSLQSGSPTYLKNFAHSSKGCKWAGVAGQVFDSNGTPLTNYIIKITGKYNGVTIKKVAVTGMVNGDPYGPGSYEIVLGSSAVKSTGKLFIQLFSPDGVALTQKISFNTSANCSKNLIIINFSQK